MNPYLLTAITASLGAVAFLVVLLLAGRRRPSMPPILHPGWDDLPTPERPPTGVAAAREVLPGRSFPTRDGDSGAPATFGVYRLTCRECHNTIQVSPIRGPSIHTLGLCDFCTARLRLDKPGFDEPGVQQNVTPDFRH